MTLPRDFPGYGRADVQIFTKARGGSASGTFEFPYCWHKPSGVSSLWMLIIGGGSGGGNGFTRVAGANGGGGGSGATSSQASLLIDAYLVPGELLISLGTGGDNLGGGGTSERGQPSAISIDHRDSTAASGNRILSSNISFATGGGNGTSVGGGAGGAATSADTVASCPHAGHGIPTFIGGSSGVAGGAPDVAGTDKNITVNGMRVLAGTGGAGVTATDRAGGGFVTITDSLLSNWAPLAAPAGSNGGRNGKFILEPLFFSYGGMGGASSNAGVGGAGGDGVNGGGGGGGGAGTTGGAGGRGGNGFGMIISW